MSKISGPFLYDGEEETDFSGVPASAQQVASDVQNLVTSAVDYAGNIYKQGYDFAKNEFTNAATLNIDAAVKDPFNWGSSVYNDASNFVTGQAQGGQQFANNAVALDSAVAQSAASGLLNIGKWAAIGAIAIVGVYILVKR